MTRFRSIYPFVFLFTEILSFSFFSSTKAYQLDVLVVIVLRTLYSFGLIFFYCEMCERISGQFGEFSDSIHQLEWYTCPLEIQRMLPIIFNHSQQSVKLVAFGGTPCTRDTFKNVNHNKPCICKYLFIYFCPDR